MTVAAAIEIGSGGTRAPGLDTAQGASRGSGLVTTENQAFSQPSASGAGSFRAGWQSLLASMGTGVGGFSSQAEALKNQGTSPAQQAFAEEARKSSTPTLPGTAGASAMARQQSGKGTGVANPGLTLSHSGAWTASAAARPVTDATKTGASSTEEKRATANLKSASASGSRTSHSAGPEVVGAGQLPGLVTSTVGAIPEAVALTNPVMHDTGAFAKPALEKTRTDTLRDLFIEPPTGPVRASSISCSSSPDPIKEADGAANTTAQGAGKGLEGPQKQGAEARAALNTEGADQAKISADKQTLTHTAAPSMAEAAASNLEQPPELSATQKPIQPLASSIGITEPQGTSSALPRMPIPVQSETPIQPGANTLSVAIGSDGLIAMPAVANANASASGPVSALSRTQDNRGPAGEKRAAASGAQRSSHETGNAGSVQHGNHIMPVESSSFVADASAALHSVTGAGGVTNTTSELTARASAATAGPDAREPFATLDAGEATGRPTWIHAGAQRAEAGFQDPALGWVGVRADTSGGGIHAELVAGSADAAQTLGGHLAGLNAYLAEHQTQVETLTLSSPESGWTALGSGSGSGDGMQQGTGNQQTGQETTQGIDSGAQLASPAAPELQARFAGRDTSVQTTRLSGNHISVVA